MKDVGKEYLISYAIDPFRGIYTSVMGATSFSDAESKFLCTVSPDSGFRIIFIQDITPRIIRRETNGQDEH